MTLGGEAKPSQAKPLYDFIVKPHEVC